MNSSEILHACSLFCQAVEQQTVYRTHPEHVRSRHRQALSHVEVIDDRYGLRLEWTKDKPMQIFVYEAGYKKSQPLGALNVVHREDTQSLKYLVELIKEYGKDSDRVESQTKYMWWANARHTMSDYLTDNLRYPLSMVNAVNL